MCRHVRRLTASFSPFISSEILKMKNKINFYINAAMKISFSRPLPLFLKIGKRFFLDDCTTKVWIHLLKIFLKIPISKRIRGEFVFSHIKVSRNFVNLAIEIGFLMVTRVLQIEFWNLVCVCNKCNCIHSQILVHKFLPFNE
jgi:hypothetical protein